MNDHKEIPYPNRMGILQQVGSDLYKLHQIQVEGFGVVRPDSFGSQLEAEYTSLGQGLDSEVKPDLDYLRKQGLIDSAEFDQISELLEETKTFFIFDTSLVLNHGDFHIGHVLVTPGDYQYQGIIDWASVKGSLWMSDLAEFMVSGGANSRSRQYLPDIISGYQGIEQDILSSRPFLTLATLESVHKAAHRYNAEYEWDHVRMQLEYIHEFLPQLR